MHLSHREKLRAYKDIIETRVHLREELLRNKHLREEIALWKENTAMATKAISVIENKHNKL